MAKVAGRSIPASLATLIDGLRWPLNPESSPPLYMADLEKMKEIRRQTPAPSDSAACTTTTTSEQQQQQLAQAMAQDVIGTVARLAGSHAEVDDQIYFARVAAALLLLGYGYTDEAHDLVSPLTWTQPTEFGFGPPVATSPQVMAVGSFVHSLIHRREAFHDSEFAMSGFGNAHYWASSTSREAAVETLPLQKIRKVAFDLATKKYPKCLIIQDWVKSMEGASIDGWESRLVHDLCAHVMQDSVAEDLRKFAERVSEAELRIMLSHTLQKLGFACDDCLRTA